MEHLIKPDAGLIFWTLVNFALLVYLLGKFGWRPAVRALEMREHKIREDVQAAQQARLAAESAKAEVEARLRKIETEAQSAIARAAALGEKEKAALLEAARKQAEGIAASARRSLEAEKDRLVAELRGEVAGLSIAAAERILAKEVDKASGERAVEEFLSKVK
ncbi:MAG: F0F1 ATP synthase subunit B [Elusimicrobiales bacterium]